jgi:hypothetical protein
LGSNHIVAVFDIFITVLLKYSPKNAKKAKKNHKKKMNQTKKKTKKKYPFADASARHSRTLRSNAVSN